jgi:hypothetical protein
MYGDIFIQFIYYLSSGDGDGVGVEDGGGATGVGVHPAVHFVFSS